MRGDCTFQVCQYSATSHGASGVRSSTSPLASASRISSSGTMP